MVSAVSRLACVSLLLAMAPVSHQTYGSETVQLASAPSLSPSGDLLAISWRGDIWTVSSNGGRLRRITSHSGRDYFPEFSPDGKTLAFCSDRTGSMQIYTVSTNGGAPQQRTSHTEGYTLESWYPDGSAFLVTARRDHFWKHAERTFRVSNVTEPRDECLFNAHAEQPAISPDATKIAFIREGTPWWRKGYRGSQAGQLWVYDSTKDTYHCVIKEETECRSPLWDPDGKTLYYLSSRTGSFNLWSHCLNTGKRVQLTTFKDDSVVSPCISRDGSTIVFRHLFDLYRLSTKRKATPQRLTLSYEGDSLHEPLSRTLLRKATHAAFTRDGLEIAFIAGGDVWVMDTILKEPRQITQTPEEESEVIFARDDKSVYFTSNAGGQPDIWRATPKDRKLALWQNTDFPLTKITNDEANEYSLALNPRQPLLSFLKGRGDLWVVAPDGKNPRRIVESWNSPHYDWSPDGKWLTFAIDDSNFNRDVYIYELDSKTPPFNLSRHPDDDYSPVWSPNGKSIAFLGRREGTEVDIHYVQLEKKDSEESTRDRKLETATKKFNAARKKPPAQSPSKTSATAATAKPAPAGAPAKSAPDKEKPATKEPDAKSPNKVSAKPALRIDFDGIHDRIRAVRIPDSSESTLVWSPDSKFLAFKATIAGKAGTYTVSPPLDLKPKLFSTVTGSNPRWIKSGNQILWLANSIPSSSAPGGKNTSYPFNCFHTVNVGERYRAAFDLCWRTMRDYFYDERLNNRDWTIIRKKYSDVAAASTSPIDLTRVVSLMLGELNGSHLGFRPSTSSSATAQWHPVTAHLGVRFDAQYDGDGLRVATVIYGGPAAKEKSRLLVGDIITRVDDRVLGKTPSLAAVLTGRPLRDIELAVRNAEGKDRSVRIRPISYSSARALLYEQWVRSNRKAVEDASKKSLAYLHIQGMNMPSFYRFEQELYEIAGDRDGIVIDVRENGGGFTTDHLLTVLTQPVHAITVPRGGTAGYPQDRRIYATWNKPIIVLCNQNSFSNAEIFSHAIKGLKRGSLVGVPTSGSVISTGSRRIMNLGTLRMPFRGWYVSATGADMELNGAVPDHILWPKPGELPGGIDIQLEKAVELLSAEVAVHKSKPPLPLRKASER
ncbi:MAG: S41 family peptidase [Pirellulaceae bacterium]